MFNFIYCRSMAILENVFILVTGIPPQADGVQSDKLVAVRCIGDGTSSDNIFKNKHYRRIHGSIS